MNADRKARPHLVYRCYGNGSLLYVGCTRHANPARRLAEHKQDQRGGYGGWASYVDLITYEEWPDFDSARTREAEVIRDERPPCNVSYSGKHAAHLRPPLVVAHDLSKVGAA